jgi:hypothetical protein
VSGVLAAVLALSLAGLPLTGGALAKLATEAQFSIGSVTILSTLTSIGTALLMTHFLNRLAVPPSGAAQECPAGLVRFWPAVALGAILLPWLFYPVVGDVSDALKLGKILWPVAIGVGLGLEFRRIGWSLPRVPAGDSIVLGEAAFHRLLTLGPYMETLDARLRQWPAAGVSLLLVVLTLLTAIVSGS